MGQDVQKLDAKAEIPNRIPAKSLTDIKLEDGCYSADFELAKRYDTLSTELERLSLLGISAYGFLLTTTGFREGSPTAYMLAMQHHRGLLALGLLCLAITAACSLSSSYTTTRCLKLQVDILRLLNRLHSPQWTSAENEVNRYWLKIHRKRQSRWLECGRILLGIATLGLIAGALLTAATFALVLLQTKGQM